MGRQTFPPLHLPGAFVWCSQALFLKETRASKSLFSISFLCIPRINVFLFVQKLPIRVCCVTLPKISDFSHGICKFRRAAQRKVSSFSLIFSLSSDWLSFLAHGWRSHSWGFGGTRMAITHSRTVSHTSPPGNRFCPKVFSPYFWQILGEY